jgi:hypothetical protein
MPTTDPPTVPPTLEGISSTLGNLAASVARIDGKAEEEAQKARIDKAKVRLEHYMRKPDLQSQPNLYKLFLAIDVAQTKPIRLLSMLAYLWAVLRMTLAGVLASLDMDKVEKTLTHNSRSIGSRLRLKRGIDKYALTVRASVGAQTVCREARNDFCATALDGYKVRDDKGMWTTPTIDLDKAVDELALPYPSPLDEILDKRDYKGAVTDSRFGDDIAEARVAIDQLISSSVVSRYIARMDELVAYIGTLAVACVALLACLVILIFPPSLLLSQLGASANTADQPCAFSIVGTALPAGSCLKPFAPIEVSSGGGHTGSAGCCSPPSHTHALSP